MSEERHLIRFATEDEKKIDCCSDRYSCMVAYVCSCGEQGCRSCTENHLFTLHWDTEADKKRQQEEVKNSALRKLSSFTDAEKQSIGLKHD